MASPRRSTWRIAWAVRRLRSPCGSGSPAGMPSCSRGTTTSAWPSTWPPACATPPDRSRCSSRPTSWRTCPRASSPRPTARCTCGASPTTSRWWSCRARRGRPAATTRASCGPAPPSWRERAGSVRAGLSVAGLRAHPDHAAQVVDAGGSEVRLVVDWAALQPGEGRWSPEATEALVSAVNAARDQGLAPWLTLLEGAIPPWFDDEGGFADAKEAGRWWPRYVEGVAERVGDACAGWFPMVDPAGVAEHAFAGASERTAALGRRGLVTGWRDAWRILHGGPPVATTLRIDTTWPALWLQDLRDGVVVTEILSDVTLTDLAGACDLLGGVVRVGKGVAAEAVAERFVRLADEGPGRPVVALVEVAGDPDAHEETADAVADGLRLAMDDGVAIEHVFATPPEPAAVLARRLVEP